MAGLSAPEPDEREEEACPLALFPGCAVLDVLPARDVHAAARVCTRWRSTADRVMGSRHATCGPKAAARLVVTGAAEASDLDKAVERLMAMLLWEPQVCVVFATDNSATFGPARRPGRKRRSRASELERVAVLRLPRDCLVVAGSSDGIIGPDESELRTLEEDGVAVLLSRASPGGRAPALLGLASRKVTKPEQLVMHGGSLSHRYAYDKMVKSYERDARDRLWRRRVLDGWLERLDATDGLHVLLGTTVDATTSVVSGGFGEGRYGRCVGGCVSGDGQLVAGVPGQLKNVAVVLLTLAFSSAESRAVSIIDGAGSREYAAAAAKELASAGVRCRPSPARAGLLAPVWGVASTCAARDSAFHGEPGVEAKAHASLFGAPAFPLIGFYALREVGPTLSRNRSRDAAARRRVVLHGYTTCLALLGTEDAA